LQFFYHLYFKFPLELDVRTTGLQLITKDMGILRFKKGGVLMDRNDNRRDDRIDNRRDDNNRNDRIDNRRDTDRNDNREDRIDNSRRDSRNDR
jgi:hypothetical protein